MISAKLTKNLQKYGFELDFPDYKNIEELIIKIIKQDNERLNLAVPLLLEQEFKYRYIKKKLKGKKLIDEFNKIIKISERIYSLENIDNKHIKKKIKENNIKKEFNKTEFNYYYESFKDSKRRQKNKKRKKLKKEIRIRGKYNINKALSEIFAPAKRRIMKKIFNHEKLTNTELKYYYKSIRPLILSILNQDMQKYLRIVESTKKHY
ncbi:hypothetical protein GF327_09095 [Candidatus Woesearchaeota archaeon]|nr:hypothetical protein [Candidatus Woesearchaeota archaeon]